ncbi:nucleotide-binding protein [Candidatus Woesearchaeota archaeon]|nr:nucleotide-binding protein [Candidatus Woesearchaeota archaeon]
MKKIILDTNILLIPYLFKVDIFSEFDRICNFNYKLYIYEQTVDELKKIIKNQSGKNRSAAKFALKMIKLKDLNIIRLKNGNVDSIILNNLSNDMIIATQDLKLKNEILKKGTSVIGLRQKKYLEYRDSIPPKL